MIDIRLKEIAESIIKYSLNIKEGEKVLIDSSKNCSEMIKYLIELIASRGAIPLVIIKENDIQRSLIKNGSKEQFEIMRKHEQTLLESVDVYINMMDSDNCYDMSDIPADRQSLYQQYYFRPINFEIIMPKLRWITVDYPSVSSAQQFGMSTEAYEKYFFDAVNTDYRKLHKAMIPLKDILDIGRHVEIISPDTNLAFDITECKAVICSGKINIPDGEVFIGPDLKSLNGTIKFNVPSRYSGKQFSNINFTFENGRVISHKSDINSFALTSLLDISEGNRYVGEFAIGTNSNIVTPKTNILFDEKILGSIHLALGNSHDLSDNGNVGSIHWDIVKMLTPEYGGGSIIVDDQLIQENGKFIPEELQNLHSKKLMRK